MKICFISPYASDGAEAFGSAGLGWYSQNLVRSLSRRVEGTFIVLAQGTGRVEVADCNGGKIVIDRCWRGRLRDLLTLLRRVRRYDPDLIHIQHEVFMFGGASSLVIVPLLALALRLRGKPIVTTLHGVIARHEFEGGLFAPESQVGPTLAFLILWMLLRAINSFSSVIIVHAEFFKAVLVSQYACPAGRIVHLPLGIEQPSEFPPQEEAKEKLGLRGRDVVLFLGYLAPYKGVENLIRAFQMGADTLGKAVLVLAGGRHPRLARQPWYRDYVRQVEGEAGNLGDRIMVKGFVPDEQIPTYFSAADVVVIPYRHVISMSGPLSIAISYERPVVVPDVPPFREMFGDTQALYALNDCADLAHKIHLVLSVAAVRDSVVRRVRELKAERSWPVVAEGTADLYRRLLKGSV